MKRVLLILVALCLLLCACNSQPEETQPSMAHNTEPTVPATTEATVPPTTQAPTEPATEPSTAPSTEPNQPSELLYTHPLTGEKLAQPATARPVAVVINNIRSAQPMHGIGQADVLFEITAEGGGTITRMLGIFTDLENVETIGSIRSARTYLISLGRSFDAPIIHCGASKYGYEEFTTTKWSHLDEIYSGGYFYRNQERIKAGYATEHTLFANGSDLMKGLKDKGIKLSYDSEADFGFSFTENVDLGGESAKEISFRFYSNGKGTTLSYDEATGMYHITQTWYEGTDRTELLADANTGEAVPFRNAFILHAKTTTDGYRMFATLTGEGKGYYACGGQIIPVIWHRDSISDPFYFTLEDGTPVSLGVGKTYIGILPSSGSLEALTYK